MARKYRSPAEGLAIRTKACELAAQIVVASVEKADGAWEEHWTAHHLMSLCVFFDSYMAHGSARTEKHMKLLEPKVTADLHVIGEKT